MASLLSVAVVIAFLALFCGATDTTAPSTLWVTSGTTTYPVLLFPTQVVTTTLMVTTKVRPTTTITTCIPSYGGYCTSETAATLPLILPGERSSSGFVTSFKSDAQTSSGLTPNALSVLIESARANVTFNALSVLEAALTITSTSTTALAKRDACTSAGIEYACGPAPTIAPTVPGTQGCGSSSNIVGSNGLIIRGAAEQFCTKEFPDTRTLRSGDNEPVATISTSDGNSITFQTQIDWLTVSRTACFKLDFITCYHNFVTAITLCDTAEEPLISGGRFDTTIHGVPVQFTVAVIPGDTSSVIKARDIRKRAVDAFFADTPNPINYITSTSTWVEPA